VPIYEAIILGIVQGLSEFLPISSSGHLLLVPWLAGWEELDPSVKKSFDVALHFGTLVAVVGYFWRDVSTYVVEGTKLVFARKVPPTTEGSWPGCSCSPRCPPRRSAHCSRTRSTAASARRRSSASR
jgi:undecaprenyl-diphosphatase